MCQVPKQRIFKYKRNYRNLQEIPYSIVGKIPACHAGVPGSIPGEGAYFFVFVCFISLFFVFFCEFFFFFSKMLGFALLVCRFIRIGGPDKLDISSILGISRSYHIILHQRFSHKHCLYLFWEKMGGLCNKKSHKYQGKKNFLFHFQKEKNVRTIRKVNT